MQYLTNSRINQYKFCPRSHELAYELGIRRADPPEYFRLGTAWHKCMELWANGDPVEQIEAAIRKNYERPPDYVLESQELQAKWYYECVTVLTLFSEYRRHYGEDGVEVLAAEKAFAFEIANPETGKTTQVFRAAGKIDQVVRLADGRIALREFKTTSADISLESDYWRRLRIDSQLSHYWLAALSLGYEVTTVIYDVVRKPGIRPGPVAVEDADGPIVLSASGERVMRKDGKGPKRTASPGEVLQTRPMTTDEWRKKLSESIQSDPSRYFQRVEIPRTEQDLREYETDLWETQKMIRYSQVQGFWPRNTGSCLSVGRGRCPYFDICTQGLDPLQAPGFAKVGNIHPELGEEGYD
jgi:hypothetical protein